MQSSMALEPVQARLAGASCSPPRLSSTLAWATAAAAQLSGSQPAPPLPQAAPASSTGFTALVGVLAGQLVGHRGPGEGGVRHVCGGEGVFVGAVVCVGPIV